jgi:hypothetical protein
MFERTEQYNYRNEGDNICLDDSKKVFTKDIYLFPA